MVHAPSFQKTTFQQRGCPGWQKPTLTVVRSCLWGCCGGLDTSVGLSVVSSKGSALGYASGSRLTCQSVRAAVPGVGEVLFDSPSCPRPRAHSTPKFLTCRGEQEISRNPNSPQDNALQGNPSLISRGELHLNTLLTSFTPESPGSLYKTPIPGPGSLLS